MTLANLINASTQKLSKISDTAKLDAEVLLCYVLKKDRSYLVSWPEKEIENAQLLKFQDLVEQRLHGHPVAHLIQQKEFWSLNLQVSPDTLIPRPETELIVEQILDLNFETENKSLLDLGTGSGAIAIALATEKPQWKVTATDSSTEALIIAKNNARQHKIKNIIFSMGSWFSAVSDQQFDIIVCNPPYIAESDPHLSEGDVRFEPSSALISGKDGLEDIRHIIAHAPDHLKPSGMLIIEHGYDQKQAVKRLFEKTGFQHIKQQADLAGMDRSTLGIIP